MRVVVAMSGGVDSSTVAGLAVEAGHDVIGLAMKTHNLEPRQNRACCTPDDMRDARRVADTLGIPFYVLNYADLFEREIVRPFAEAYLAGHTPNPCVACNHRVKFRPLLERAHQLGADRLLTGHYARIDRSGGRMTLRRGADPAKDQSYFLYRLNSEQLARLDFPLGSLHKSMVREHAYRLGLGVENKEESQEICFVGADGYAATVEKIAGRAGRVGPILDDKGSVLGQHRGIHRFTVGQRRGLGLAAAEPLYVTNIDAESGAIHVGRRSELLVDELLVEDFHWLGAPPSERDEVLVQQRYREPPKPAHVVEIDGRRVRLCFSAAVNRGAPGQACVLYRGDEVLGGGVIAVLPPPTSNVLSEARAHHE